MADEFMKGLGIFTGSALGWIVLAGWYRTPSFESTRQLIAPPAEPETAFDTIGVFLVEVFFWTAIIGALTFWVVIPLAQEAREYVEDSA